MMQSKLENYIKIAKETITENILQIAAEIFTFLNYCPRMVILYRSIFDNASAKDIILALNTILKYPHNSNQTHVAKIFSHI